MTDPGGRVSPAGWLRRSAFVRTALAVLLLAGLGAGCTEDAVVGPGPEGSEGAETVELVLTPEDMREWRDTTFSGFAVAADAGFLLVEETEALRARTLLKYRVVPDSVTIDTTRHAVEEYTAARVQLAVDTVATRLPPGTGQLRLTGLTRDWEPTEATWTRAAEGRPWETPGGDLGEVLSGVDLEGVSDSALAGGLVLEIPGSKVDSMLEDWSRNEGGRGAALAIDEGSGARLRVTRTVVEIEVRPADEDTTVTLQLSSLPANDPATFIHDPETAGPPEGLRLGGLPARRFYFRFRPPDSAGGVPLRSGTINRAELAFRPLSAPAAPFALERSGTAELIELIDDPLGRGARTPLAGTVARRDVDPDSLAAGAALRFGFTGLMSRWAADPDSFGAFNLGVRMNAEASSFGFWDFGDGDGGAQLRPVVRLLITPATTFDLP